MAPKKKKLASKSVLPPKPDVDPAQLALSKDVAQTEGVIKFEDDVFGLPEDRLDVIRKAKQWRLQEPKVTADPLVVLLPTTVLSLINAWSVYQPMLVESVNKLRDYKLVKYAEMTYRAKRDVGESYTRANVWKTVFEERFGLSGDPEQAASTFMDHGIEKLVPEDLENIKTYIRVRSLFLMLYYEAETRRSPALNKPEVVRVAPETVREVVQDEKEAKKEAFVDQVLAALNLRRNKKGRTQRKKIGGATVGPVSGLDARFTSNPSWPLISRSPHIPPQIGPRPIGSATRLPRPAIGPRPIGSPIAIGRPPMRSGRPGQGGGVGALEPRRAGARKKRQSASDEDEEDEDDDDDDGAGVAASPRGSDKITQNTCWAQQERVLKLQQKQLEWHDYKPCWEAKDEKQLVQCLDKENAILRQDINKWVDKLADVEDDLRKLKDRREALQGEQTWMTGRWPVDALPTAEAQLGGPNQPRPKPDEPVPPPTLYDLLNLNVRGPRPLIGRADILNTVAGMIHTFANNYQAYTNTFLNWAMLGPPGTGKTTIAKAIGAIFQRLGILLTDKFSIVTREDLVAGFLGQTAMKTKAVLIDHIEGTLFLDEAYQLGLGGDEYGLEAATTIVNFLDKYMGSIVMFAAGYEDKMDRGFFGANEGMERRFRRWYLPAYNAEQLLQIFYAQLSLRLLTAADRAAWSSPNVWSLLLQSFELLNRGCVNPGDGRPCFLQYGGGDMQTLAGVATEYYNTIVAPAKRKVNACDVQRILRQFLFQQQRANVLLTSEELESQCEETATDKIKTNYVTIPLTRPNTNLISPKISVITPSPIMARTHSTGSRPSRPHALARAGGQTRLLVPRPFHNFKPDGSVLLPPLTPFRHRWLPFAARPSVPWQFSTRSPFPPNLISPLRYSQ
jgi:hypothetical protein